VATLGLRKGLTPKPLPARELLFSVIECALGAVQLRLGATEAVLGLTQGRHRSGGSGAGGGAGARRRGAQLALRDLHVRLRGRAIGLGGGDLGEVARDLVTPVAAWLRARWPSCWQRSSSRARPRYTPAVSADLVAATW